MSFSISHKAKGARGKYGEQPSNEGIGNKVFKDHNGGKWKRCN